MRDTQKTIGEMVEAIDQVAANAKSAVQTSDEAKQAANDGADAVGRTVERMEAGNSTQMSSFIRVLRVLDVLEQFLNLFPEPGLSPMQLVRSQRQVRRRVSPRRKRARIPDGDWTWGSDK